MLRATDMRRKINSELKGKSEAEQARVIEGYIQDWPPNVRGEYVEIRRHLVRRLEKLRTSSRVRASTGAPSDDPFVVAKSGHLTAALVGLPNAGKSYVFHRLGGDGATIAGSEHWPPTPGYTRTAISQMRSTVSGAKVGTRTCSPPGRAPCTPTGCFERESTDSTHNSRRYPAGTRVTTSPISTARTPNHIPPSVCGRPCLPGYLSDGDVVELPSH